MLLIIPAGTEWLLIIGVIGVMFFGVKKIPPLARSLGSATSEFEKAKIQADRELRRLKTGEGDEAENRDRLETIADTLGINHDRRSDEELRKDIHGELRRRESV